MTPGAAKGQEGVWLFTREPESVRLSVQPVHGGFRLVISGPGSATATFEFASPENLDRFRSNYEQDLRARGFERHTPAERRRDVDERLGRPRPSPNRRRWRERSR